MEAFVLVQTEVGKAALVADQVAAIDGVQRSEYVLGPYDVVVRITGEDDGALHAVVHDIQKVTGITRTLTCPITA